MIKSIQDWTKYLLYVDNLMFDACSGNDANAIIRLNLVWHLAKNELIRLQAVQLLDVA